MPTKHAIIEGPPYKYFFFGSHAVSASGNISQFELSGWPTGDDRTSFHILNLGKVLSRQNPDEDEFRFIARSHSGSARLNKHACYLVGKYNPQTRKGECEMFEAEEMAMCPVAKILLGP